jgi:hypothetical protein
MTSTANEMKSKYRALGSDPELRKDIDRLASDWSVETAELIHNGNVVSTTHTFDDGSKLNTLDIEEAAR